MLHSLEICSRYWKKGLLPFKTEFHKMYYLRRCECNVHTFEVCPSFFSGWISSLTGLNRSIPVGIMMIIIAALFTASAVISLVMFKKVSNCLTYSVFAILKDRFLFVPNGNKSSGLANVKFLAGQHGSFFCSFLFNQP